MQGDPLSQSIPSSPSPPPTSNNRHIARKSAYHQALSSEVINLRELRTLAVGGGFPDDNPSIRAQVWQLFLGYLPLQRSQWENSIKKKEAEYLQFCKELIIDPQTLGRPPVEFEEAAAAALKSSSTSTTSPSLERTTVSHDDHPLSTSDSSRWRAFFADAEIKEQIERDVDRTHPDLHFFKSSDRAAMRRALFIFAKLNPGLQYVQGMNELFAVLYHTFAIGGSGGGGDDASDDKRLLTSNKQPSSAECAAFFCFIDLFGEFRDNFCQQLDNSTIGIKGTLGKLSSFLKSFDLVLWTHLEQKNGVNPQFYAFRWITTLLTQEFNFPDVIRLWDALLLDPEGRPECLLRMCLAMVLLVREELLQGDFASNLKLLQHYPQSIDVAVILKTAEELKSYKTIIVLDE
jgi:TBC1 domain family member 13